MTNDIGSEKKLNKITVYRRRMVLRTFCPKYTLLVKGGMDYPQLY
jgi:hypothetical protein